MNYRDNIKSCCFYTFYRRGIIPSTYLLYEIISSVTGTPFSLITCCPSGRGGGATTTYVYVGFVFSVRTMCGRQHE